VRIAAADRAGRERLLRYCARPPFALKRLCELDPERLLYDSAKRGPDGALWIWGRRKCPEPRRVLPGVTGAAAGSDASIALTQDGALWQWRTGGQPAMVLHCPDAHR